MKKLFVSELDTALGRRIVEKFGRTQEFEIVGTTRSDPVRAGLSPEEAADEMAKPLPPWVKEIVPAYVNDPVEFKKKVLDADVIICPMRDSAQEAAAAIRMLANMPFDVEKTFVLVSSTLTWADTYTRQKAEEAAARFEERQAALEAGEELDEEPEEAAEPEEVPVFGEDAYQKRTPHRRYQHWKDVEHSVKAANSDTLHTYVLFSGLTYGGGEDMLEPIFKAAWHLEPLPMITDGANTVPMIHIDDLATAVFKAGTYLEVLPARYILGVDRGNHTWGQVLKAINTALGGGESVIEPRVGSVAHSDWMTIDIKLEGSTINDLVDESEWAAPEGFVAAAEKVAAEYREARGLTPVRAAIVGPPQSGKSTLAEEFAKVYSVERVTSQDIIDNYVAYRDKLITDIAAHRKMRLLEKKRAEELEKKRAAEEAAAAAAEEAAAAAAGEDGEADAEADAAADKTAEDAAAAKRDDDEEPFNVSFEVDAPIAAPAAEDGDEPAAEGDAAKDADDEPAAAVDPAANDDEDDEILNKMKDDLSAANKVLALKLKGRFVDAAMAVMGRFTLLRQTSKNQGYILDGFPRNVKQAANLFMVGDIPLPEFDDEGALPADEEADPAALLAAADDALLFDWAFVASCDENIMLARCNESNPHASLENFYRRLAQYKADNGSKKPAQGLEAWLGAILTNKETAPRSVSVLQLDMSNCTTLEAIQRPMDTIRRAVGPAHVLRPTPAEIVAEREAKILADERARIAELHRVEEEQRAADEAAAAKTLLHKKDLRRLESVAQERVEAAAVTAMTMQDYQMKLIVPAVTAAMTHVAQLRPEDAVNSLADYLFTYEPNDTLPRK